MYVGGLNPEPTELQWALYRRHKRAGTSPGNPKWYRPQVVKPFVFKSGQPAKLPRYPTGAEWHAKHATTRAYYPGQGMMHYKDGSTRNYP
jgi:hypothetical protein